MGKLFRSPQTYTPPPVQPATPMPVRDEEAARREKMKQYSAIAARGGRESTQLGATTSRLGDAPQQVNTRGGPSILGAG